MSTDGKGRYTDDLFVESFLEGWWTIKYEEVYLKACQSVAEARAAIGQYLWFYNNERPHQALGYRTPRQVFQGGLPKWYEKEEKAGSSDL